MKRIPPLFLALTVTFALSITVRAQTTVTVGFNNLAGGNGGPTGIYQGTLNGTPDNFICADDTHTIGYGISWPANMYSLTALLSSHAYAYINNPSGAGFNTGLSASAAEAWTAEAYLEFLIISGFDHGSLSSNQIGALNYAVWALTSYNYLDPNGLYGDSNAVDPGYTPGYYIGLAQTAYLGGWGSSTDANAVRFFVPTGNGTNSYGPPQLFSDVATPEPLSMVLMGTFLSLAGLGLGKKKLQS